MLQAIRSRASGIVVQILFGVLILTFALWGIGDIFRGRGPDTSVASVGDTKIDAAEVSRALRQQVDQMRQTFHAALTEEQIKELGLVDTTLNEVISQHLLDLEADRLGLAVNDAAVRQAIVSNPAFHGPSGLFDRNVYLQLLGASQLTDQQYESLLRTEMIRGRIADAVTSGAGAPSAVVDALWQTRGERRVATALLVPPSAAGAASTPDQAALDKYYDAHKDQFMQPERRSFTVALIDATKYLTSVKFSDAELKAAYDKRKDQFVEPEKRVLQQIIVPDEAKAKTVEAALASGKDFPAVAKDIAGEAPDAINLGALSQAEMPGDLGKAVFALQPGGMTKPVKDPFGWHIVKLVSVTPEATMPFDKAKKRLEEDLARDQAADQVSKTANAIDDALAAGATFKDVVAKFGLKTVQIDGIDSQGRDVAGKEAAALPQPPDAILKTAFATATGQPSDLKEMPDGYFLLAVDKVMPANPQPLAQVKDKVVAGWQAEEQATRLGKLGSEIAGAVDKGQKIEDLAALHGFKTLTTQPLSRNANSPDLPPQLVAKLFSVKKGQAATAEFGARGEVVAVVSAILPPDPKEEAAQKAGIARDVDQSIKNDLMTQYEQSLRQRYPVSVNRDALDHLL